METNVSHARKRAVHSRGQVRAPQQGLGEGGFYDMRRTPLHVAAFTPLPKKKNSGQTKGSSEVKGHDRRESLLQKKKEHVSEFTKGT